MNNPAMFTKEEVLEATADLEACAKAFEIIFTTREDVPTITKVAILFKRIETLEQELAQFHRMDVTDMDYHRLLHGVD